MLNAHGEASLHLDAVAVFVFDFQLTRATDSFDTRSAWLCFAFERVVTFASSISVFHTANQ